MNFEEFAPSPMTFGRKSSAVEPSDSSDLPGGAVKGVTTTTAGNISVIPIGNADNDPVAFTDVPVGFVPPFIVRRVMATGTTATVRTVED